MFFHRSTLDQRSHNRISKLEDSQGEELVSHIEIESFLVKHFLSTAEELQVDRSWFINKFTKYLSKLVTREENHNLNKLVSK